MAKLFEIKEPAEHEKPWREIAAAIVDERNPEKVNELSQELIKALDNQVSGQREKIANGDDQNVRKKAA